MRYSQALVTEYMCLVRYELNLQEVSGRKLYGMTPSQQISRRFREKILSSRLVNKRIVGEGWGRQLKEQEKCRIRRIDVG